MRWLLATLCAILLLLPETSATAQTITNTLMGGGSSGGGAVSPCGSVPTEAAALGLNTCTFQAGPPFTTANFDSTASQGAGFKLYMDDCLTSVPDPTHNFINGSGQLSVGQSAGGLQHSVASATCIKPGAPCSTCWHGTAFGGAFYLEEKATIVQSSAGTGAGSWPAMWMVSLESRTAEAFWPGQAAGYYDYAEFDYPFEYFQGSDGFHPNTTLQVSTHNWYTTTPIATSPSGDQIAAATFSVPHKYGVLYIPATGSTAGTCGSINLYIDDVLQNTTQYTWSVYNSGAAPPPSGTGCPGVSSNMSIADAQHLMLRFDASNANPLILYYANVWQTDGSKNRTNVVTLMIRPVVEIVEEVADWWEKMAA